MGAIETSLSGLSLSALVSATSTFVTTAPLTALRVAAIQTASLMIPSMLSPQVGSELDVLCADEIEATLRLVRAALGVTGLEGGFHPTRRARKPAQTWAGGTCQTAEGDLNM